MSCKFCQKNVLENNATFVGITIERDSYMLHHIYNFSECYTISSLILISVFQNFLRQLLTLYPSNNPRERNVVHSSLVIL